jgi:hypothetical protein
MENFNLNDVKNKITKKENTNNFYLFKYTKSKTWGFTCSVLENNKKVGYAGGCGYDKAGAAFSDFLLNNFFNIEDSKTRLDLYNYLSSGGISDFNYINFNRLTNFFNILGFTFEYEKTSKFKDVDCFYFWIK